MSWVGVLAIVLIGLFFSGFFSGAETGLYRVNRLRLRLRVHQGDPRSVRLSRFLADEQGALGVTLVGTNVANYVTTVAATYFFAKLVGLSDSSTQLYTVAIITPIVFVFGEMVPKTLFQLHPDRLLALGSVILAISNRLLRMTGILWALTRLANLINRAVGIEPSSDRAQDPKRRIATLLQEALARETYSEQQSLLIDEICRLSETPLHQVMVPRNRVRVIAADADRRELLRVARRTEHTRIPVYAKSARHIIGTVKIDQMLLDDDWGTVGERLVPPLLLGPHERVATAMARMRQEGQRLAIVVDRSGHLLGVVAPKDLLRKAIGEIVAEV